MANCEEIYKIDIPNEIFKNEFILNKDLEELKYYIKLFFKGILLDKRLDKELGYHFFNQLISIQPYEDYDMKFREMESLCSYDISKLELLLMSNSKKNALNKFLYENNDLKSIENELNIFVDMMYLINNPKNYNKWEVIIWKKY